MLPASATRLRFGSRPVRIAGQTTRGVAASMTTRRTFPFTGTVYYSGIDATFWAPATLPL